MIRRITAAFLMTVLAMTGIVWATQALRQLDLVTSKGQTILQFFGITGLIIPSLLTIVAPFALMIALIIILNSMSNDSELIVINATGGSRFLVMTPVILIALLVTIFVAFLSTYLSPVARGELRQEVTRVRADLIANIVQPGRFVTVDNGLTFHIRNRSGDGDLEGLLLNDIRDPKTTFTYQAEVGNIVDKAGRTMLVMHNGTIQRRPQGGDEISIVRFETYAFDLTSLIPEPTEAPMKVSDRPTLELIDGDSTDSYALSHPEKLVIELHDRMSQPLYPLAFGFIIFALLGKVRTTRQGNSSATLSALIACILLRTAGFGVTTLVSAFPSIVFGYYVVPLFGIAVALYSILFAWDRPTPIWMQRLSENMTDRLERLRQRLNGNVGASQ